MQLRRFLGLATLTCVMTMAGCGGNKVMRVDPNSTTDLSGQWNDTDSRMVADEMIADCLSRPWLANNYPSKPPVTIVGRVRNMSHEHINTETFTKDLERSLINSGKVEFVANSAERTQLREEKADQMSGNATDETMKQAGKESGADIMLIGSINTIADQEGNTSVMYYQVNLELVQIESNKKMWIGDKKIKKIITRSRATL